jgi:hypothetical protein
MCAAFSAREGLYRPSITLEAGNKVAFNFGAEPFLFAPEGYQPVDVSAKIPPGRDSTYGPDP